MNSRSATALIASTLFINFGLSQAKQFSTNAICRQWNCINPVFPGLEDLQRLQATQLQCQSVASAKDSLQFCKNAVYYDLVALPSPNKSMTNVTLASVVQQQDNAAATMYMYHLAGMNVEGWEHRKPDEEGNPCTQAVWKMVCATYFPRAEAGCKANEATKLLAPCKNVCGNYIEACQVECCDESVQCVFDNKVSLLDGKEIMTSGYVDELGPSNKCTGASSRKSPSFVALIAAGLTFLQFMLPGHQRAGVTGTGQKFRLPLSARKCAMCIVLFTICSTLQGCMLGQLFSHPTPTWEEVPNYWEKFQYIPEGAPAKEKIYNSCDLVLPKEQECSGHGECSEWRPDMKVTAGGKTMKFCKCFRDWADPECRTKRKSQMVAYFLSVFLGVFGADHFYLAHYYSGFAKLASFGGLGVWWVADIVRIGSSPIYSSEYRLAYDLPHWFYVMFTVAFFTVLGYFIFGSLARASKYEKARSNFLMKEEELDKKKFASAGLINPEDKVGMPTFASYGLPMNTAMGYGAVPAKMEASTQLNPFSPYAVFQHARQGYMPPAGYDPRGQPRDRADFERKASRLGVPEGYGY